MLKRDHSFRARLAIILLAVVVAWPIQAKDNYHLGKKASAAEIAGWNIDVRPDGAGLPDGHGSVAQGNDIYDANCAMCHGTFGESNEYLALTAVGAKLNYATTLFDYINRAMPFPHSKSLTADQVYAVSAYVLNLNNVVPGNFVADKNTLPKVKMPYRDGFKTFPGLMSVHGKPDVHNTACMKNCEKDPKVTASLPKGFVKNLYGDIRDNFRGLSTMNEEAPPTSESAAPPDLSGQDLVQKNGCAVCHAIDKKIVGPAFRDVAAKYKGNPDALKALRDKIRKGGAGVWGTIPMPPHPDVSNADLDIMVRWVLDQSAKK
ncbi:MAG: c-type cytochrome [Rhodanobacter sp.]|jgi:cytochrome c